MGFPTSVQPRSCITPNFPKMVFGCPKANHHVQNCPWSRCSTNFVSYPSGSTHQMQPPVQVQAHIGVHNRIHRIFLPPNNSPVERTWQRNRSDFHQLLQKSSALVRRSSTWYLTSGVCRLRSRSRSRSKFVVFRINFDKKLQVCCKVLFCLKTSISDVVAQSTTYRTVLTFWQRITPFS